MRLQNGQSIHCPSLRSWLRGVTIAGPEETLGAAAALGNALVAQLCLLDIRVGIC
jgi:hypothetical protein